MGFGSQAGQVMFGTQASQGTYLATMATTFV